MNPSTGYCASGQALTMAECAALHGQVVDGVTVDYRGAGNWAAPESCSCYFDNAGGVWFNQRITGCNGAEPGEISICKHAAAGTCRRSNLFSPHPATLAVHVPMRLFRKLAEMSLSVRPNRRWSRRPRGLSSSQLLPSTHPSVQVASCCSLPRRAAPPARSLVGPQPIN